MHSNPKAIVLEINPIHHGRLCRYAVNDIAIAIGNAQNINLANVVLFNGIAIMTKNADMTIIAYALLTIIMLGIAIVMIYLNLN